jgi:hypothetical protein
MVEARGVVLATVLATLLIVGMLGYVAGRYSTELFPPPCDEVAGSGPCR